MSDTGLKISGFEIPLHHSLTEQIMMAGVPRNIALVNGTLAAAMGLGLRLWLVGFLIWAVGHGIAAFAARKDPQFLEVLIRHLKSKPYLEA
tara:strand:- start:1730 stop:2002 length:273 start_codon:yes stop_codon:yes gene_type:complete